MFVNWFVVVQLKLRIGMLTGPSGEFKCVIVWLTMKAVVALACAPWVLQGECDMDGLVLVRGVLVFVLRNASVRHVLLVAIYVAVLAVGSAIVIRLLVVIAGCCLVRVACYK